jgi:hypothetical protein
VNVRTRPTAPFSTRARTTNSVGGSSMTRDPRIDESPVDIDVPLPLSSRHIPQHALPASEIVSKQHICRGPATIGTRYPIQAAPERPATLRTSRSMPCAAERVSVFAFVKRPCAATTILWGLENTDASSNTGRSRFTISVVGADQCVGPWGKHAGPPLR